MYFFYIKIFNAINFSLNTALGTSQILVCCVFNFIQLKTINFFGDVFFDPCVILKICS